MLVQVVNKWILFLSGHTKTLASTWFTPTWAGTFVLAALVFLFPDTNLVLLDSDYIPITLFEVDELWALTTEPVMPPTSQTQVDQADSPIPKARKTTKEGASESSPQRVLLVTEPHTDINAGLVVVLDSGHDAPVDIEDLACQAASLDDAQKDNFWLQTADKALQAYRSFTHDYLCHCNDPTLLSVEEQGLVTQSGLALSPVAWAHTRFTADWAIAWALMGEWASRELFPPPQNGPTEHTA